MFVGFIAVIVILLIIVGVMSTSAGKASGGVEQTKVTKVVSEISELAQSIGFYKSLTTDGSYTGISIDKLIDQGIIKASNVITVATGDGTIDIPGEDKLNSNNAAGNNPDKLIKSKIYPGIYYTITEGANTSEIYVEVLTWMDLDSDKTSLIDSTLISKYTQNSAETGSYDDDGAVTITFK